MMLTMRGCLCFIKNNVLSMPIHVTGLPMRKRSAPVALKSSRGRIVKPKLWHDGTKLSDFGSYGLDTPCGSSAPLNEHCKFTLAAEQAGCAPAPADSGYH